MDFVDNQQLYYLVGFQKRLRASVADLTEAISPSPVGFLVTTSHFSGVVTIICVLAISAFVSCMSPTQHIKIEVFEAGATYLSALVLQS